MIADGCPYCRRDDCQRFKGSRSESAYEDCIVHTSAAEKQAREAVLKSGRDPKWAAVYAWLDGNKDAVIKDMAEQNGALERERDVLLGQVARLERNLTIVTPCPRAPGCDRCVRSGSFAWCDCDDCRTKPLRRARPDADSATHKGVMRDGVRGSLCGRVPKYLTDWPDFPLSPNGPVTCDDCLNLVFKKEK